MRKPKELKAFPPMKNDGDAERFVDTADLSEYDFSGFKPAQFEFAPKDSTINMRVPTPLLDAVKSTAARAGMPYQRFIRQLLENAIGPGKGGAQ